MTFLRPLRVVATVACLAVVGAACTTEEDESSLSGSQSVSQSGASESSSGGSSGATGATTEAPASSGGEVSTSDPGTTSPTTTVDPNTTSGGSTTSGGDTTSGGTTTGNQGGCGDGVINGNEQCDGANLNNFTCEALGNAGGTLLCDPMTCTFDTQMCDVGGSGGTSG